MIGGGLLVVALRFGRSGMVRSVSPRKLTMLLGLIGPLGCAPKIADGPVEPPRPTPAEPVRVDPAPPESPIVEATPQEPPAPRVVAEHQVAADVAGADEDILRVTVSWAAQEKALELPSEFSDCEYMDAAADPVEGAEGLHMVQLFCNNGEDFATRESLTALLRVGAAGDAEILWHGEGTSSREMSCVDYDVLYFKPNPDGTVAVLRSRGAYGGDGEGCAEEDYPDEQVTTVKVD